jgi:hypothetical protein
MATALDTENSPVDGHPSFGDDCPHPAGGSALPPAGGVNPEGRERRSSPARLGHGYDQHARGGLALQ